jgi:hypothetical protein
MDTYSILQNPLESLPLSDLNEYNAPVPLDIYLPGKGWIYNDFGKVVRFVGADD